MTPGELARMHCAPQHGPPMAGDELARHLALTPRWAVAEGMLERRIEFTDFHATMAFVNAVAWIAHREDHHPDLTVGYDRCTVRFSTHSVKGLSENDFICAARINVLLDG
jgi:4a-hydroxytetrahydrobiopterin dehydratase